MASREASQTRPIVVDTNVLVSGALHSGVVRRLLQAPRAFFTTPVHCLEEVREHEGDWRGRGVSPEDVHAFLAKLRAGPLFVAPPHTYRHTLALARTLVNDPDDAPVAALALAIPNDGLWTFNRRDFLPIRDVGLRLLTTREVRLLLEGP